MMVALSAAVMELKMSRHPLDKPVSLDFARNSGREKRTGTQVTLSSQADILWTVPLQVGTPRQQLYVHIDTGSTDTYVESEDCTVNCDSAWQYRPSQSSSFSRVQCNSPLCIEKEPCLSNGECSFKTTYVDQSFVLGNVAQDEVQMGSFSGTGTLGTMLQASPDFNTFPSSVSGIMGCSNSFGDWGQPTLLMKIIEAGQLPNAFAFCFQYTGGTMFLGEDPNDISTPYIFTPYTNVKYDMVWLDVMLDGESLKLSASELNNQFAIVDTGTTLFSLPTAIYNAFVSKLQSFCTTRNLKGVCDLQEGDITQGARVTMSYEQVLEYPTLTLTLWGVYLHIRPQAYLWGTGYNSPDWTLGIRPSSVTLIGDVVLKHLRVIFDRTEHRVGFAAGRMTRERDEKRAKKRIVIA